MVFVFHQLAYFTEHNALQFQLCCCKTQELLSFCCVAFHCVNVPQCFDPLIYSWALRSTWLQLLKGQVWLSGGHLFLFALAQQFSEWDPQASKVSITGRFWICQLSPAPGLLN